MTLPARQSSPLTSGWRVSSSSTPWARFMSRASKTRNETHRICDVLGLESLVDEIAHKIVSESGMDPTSSSILGPFWSPNAPFRAHGDVIFQDGVPAGGRVTKMHGVIRDITTGQPIPNAVFDIWQASSNGKYDFQDPDNQSPNNLRGKFRADANGRYWFYCLHPTAYSLPRDGPSWQLLTMMDRHPMRPAHIHIMVTHQDFQGCTTQLYPSDDPWIKSDTVFAVKDDLVVEFKPLKDDPKATLGARVQCQPRAQGLQGPPLGDEGVTARGVTMGKVKGCVSLLYIYRPMYIPYFGHGLDAVGKGFVIQRTSDHIIWTCMRIDERASTHLRCHMSRLCYAFLTL
ncbi:hypothetical protein CHGG_09243 [Chaetomium globosum CBS 148.51]|uniref:Intradiol ring-cleavage dioxygenases domain-containing protein n=1 Tax=Chaetomium globosum (strain ATCC 6205 / CBS 148.51 / DSM 1962 / NBRC 6347 / NRRL 1970) TaxID=306901 RepID=Q2GS11_CHAGB|nr:uncharacterized protein CHGG_09243 [Chaetomium globosum CBS 148.51]EAQ85229.1 hypothetical protein CHGG_09243 [Chaetomium globosum CBS 148.51]